MSGYITEIEETKRRVAVNGHGDGALIRIDDREFEAEHVWLDNSGQNLLLLIDGRSYDFRIEEEEDGGVVLTYAGRRYRGTVVDERLADLRRRAGISDTPSGRGLVKAPMPGLVVKILVAVGDTVTQGQRLLVLEAMKMENDVKASRDGQIASVAVVAGQPVESGAELMVIE
jgi:pyruvate carboxylase subunit B